MSASEFFGGLFILACLVILFILVILTISFLFGVVLGIYEAFLAPKLEQWAEEYIAHRRAKRSQQPDHNLIPAQIPALVQQEVQQTQGLQVRDRPRASGIGEWRNEVERRRSLSRLRRRTRPISQVNVNPEPSPPSTLLSFNPSSNGTIIPSRPASPTPQVSPVQSSPPSPLSQVIMVQVASTVSAPLGNDTSPDDNPVTVRYLDELAPEIPTTSRNSTPTLSPPTPYTAGSISEFNSRLPPVTAGFASPILFSPANGAHEQVGSSSSSLPSEIDIVWSSTLSPGFPHFELPSVKFSSDTDMPGDQGSENTFSSLGI